MMAHLNQHLNGTVEPITTYEFYPQPDIQVAELSMIICGLGLIVVNQQGFDMISKMRLNLTDTEGVTHELFPSRHFRKNEPSPIVIAQGIPK